MNATARSAIDTLTLFLTLVLVAIAVWNDAWTEAIFWGLVHAWTTHDIRRREGL